MEEDERLKQLFDEKLESVNELLRQKKKQAFSRARNAGLTCLLISVAATLFSAWNAEDETLTEIIALCGAVVTLVVALGVLVSTLGEREQIFKEQVVALVVKFLDPGLDFTPKACIPEETYEDSCIFTRSADRYRGEDLVCGTFQNIPVRFSELHTEYKTKHTDSKGHTTTTWHEIFRGIFFEADFNKDFHGTTLVVPDFAERFLGQTIGRFFQKMDFSRPGKLIRMENVDFEKIFAVYATDDVEARYILTPKLMERILELNKRLGDSCVALSFRNSHVYLAIPLNRQYFEYHGGDVTFENVRHVRDELMSILDIIREMD